ncbi:MAG: SDR family NAD(P)-dependent oxidoreductase [Myxococcota bacterium]
MELVVITGASRGLGLAITKRLLIAGYQVVALSRTKGDALCTLIEAHPDQIVHYACDLEQTDEIPETIQQITRNHGPIFGLVNNAGIGLDGLLATQHTSEIRRVIRLNQEAPILLAKYACRSMLGQRRGRIINITSIIAQTGYSGLAVYAATKAALEGFTRALARELGRVNVTVNCVAPGYMETAMTAKLDGAQLESVKRRAPLGLPDPEDAAESVAFLLSEAAKRITGTVVTVDGGATA